MMLNLFYRNGQLLLLSLVLIIVWGSTSFLSLPRLEDPVLTVRNATITTLFPGASAERVEALVTEKIEDELAENEQIDVLTSTSRLGISVVQVELKETVQGVDAAWSQVRDQLDDVLPLLPEGSLDPEFELALVQANTLIVGVTWDGAGPPNWTILRRLAEEVQDQLRSLPGSEKVELFGDPQEEIVVEIDPVELAALGLTPANLSEVISASDAKVTAGQLRGDRNTLLFEVEGELDSLDRIRRIPIQVDAIGQVARIGDIARVKRGVVDPLAELALLNGQPAVVISATTESGARVDRWAEAARELLPIGADRLPSGVGLEIVLDQSRTIEARLNIVIGNLLVGALLVIGVALVIMGWKSAVIVGSALPLTTLMVFGCMKVLGVPLHQISITGLIIALGLLIDNAIITVDEVQIRLRGGMSPGEAVTDSVRHLAIPLLSSTLTTVLAFMPIALAPGGVGEFTGTIGVTVILALTSSLILALTVLPSLVARLNRWSVAPVDPAWWQDGLRSQPLAQIYRWTLYRTLSRPWLTIGLMLVIPVSGFLTFPALAQQFFPPAGRDQFYIEVEHPTQTSLAQTQRTVEQATDMIRTYERVTGVHWFVGNAAPSFYYNVVGGQERSPNYAQGIVQLTSTTGISELIQTVQRDLDRTFPGVRVLVRQLEQGPPFPAPVEVRLYGPDLEQLRQLGDEVRLILSQLADVTHTRASLTEALPKLALELEEEEVRRAGLTKAGLAGQLDAYLEGSVGGSILEGTEELPVRVRVSSKERSQLDQVASLDLVGAGQPIPLTALGSIDLTPDTAQIDRRDRQRVNTVQAFITAGVLPDQVLTRFRERLQELGFALPVGYRLDFGGEADARGTAVVNLLSTVGVLGVLMVATLVLCFNSFGLAALIGGIAVCAVGLGVGALFLSGYPFGFTAILGTLGLVGLAINDSIVVLAALQQAPLARRGDPWAILRVVEQGTRHILATTVTTLVGFVPLLFDATGFWPPLAICIAGGLGGTTLMALYVVPSVYVVLSRTRWEAKPRASNPGIDVPFGTANRGQVILRGSEGWIDDEHT